MKFIKLEIKSSSEELDNILDNMDIISMGFMEDIYHKKPFVEFDLTNGLGIMFGAMHEQDVVKLMSIYVNYEVDFSYEDMTRSVLFGKIPKLNDLELELLEVPEDANKILADFAQNFLDENLTEDIVLEKITLNGIESITPQDKFILDNVKVYVKKIIV